MPFPVDAGPFGFYVAIMAIRLYESAWVRVEGSDKPLQVHRDRKSAAAFNVGEYQYDIDARPLRPADQAPSIVAVLNLQAVREAGLATDYNRDLR